MQETNEVHYGAPDSFLQLSFHEMMLPITHAVHEAVTTTLRDTPGQD